MNFEHAPQKENSVRLILESVAEQLADELQSELNVLSHDVDKFVFQPFLIPEIGSTQRVGPSLEFVNSFLENMLVRLENLHADVNWKDGLMTQVSRERIVTIRVSFNELNK